MPAKVPAPSKGALRALRHIALGTTCTIAFSTALLTEDRRRRIQAAHAVNENKRKIKSYSRYHNSGTAASPDFEDDVVRYGYFEPSPRERVPRVLELEWSDTCPAVNNVDAPRPENPQSNVAEHQPDSERKRYHEQVDREYETLTRRSQLASARTWISTTNDSPSKLRSRTEQNPVAVDPVSRNLTLESVRKVGLEKGAWKRRAASMEESLNVDDVNVVDSVAENYLDLFYTEWEERSLGRSMFEVVQKLHNACIHHQRMDNASKILQTVCQSTILDEETFMSFRPEMILEHLISKPGFQIREAEDGRSFEQAVALFCPLLKKKPELPYPGMATIGQRICEKAFQAQDYDLFDKIYWRSQAWCPGNTKIGVDMLITAQQNMENHKKVVDYFIRLLPKSGTDFNIFVKMALVAVNSAMKLGKLPKAEAILQVAADIARTQGHLLPDVLLLMVLRDHWKVTSDFTSLKALFERLEKYFDRIREPARLYGYMIQMCLEADHSNDIHEYVDKAAVHKVSDASKVWIRGHLALAKGIAGDWAGVDDEFKDMSNSLRKSCSVKDFQRIMCASFTPNLKLFIKRHDVTQTEEFLHRFIDRYGVVPNRVISNMVIGVYVEADELNSIPEWLRYARSKGLELNATSFNILLQNLKRRWRLPYSKLHPIYVRVKELDESLINEVTLRLLGTSAIETYGQQGTPKIAKRALQVPRDSHGVKYAMNVAMSRGEFRKALETYRLAKRNKICLPTSILDLAIEAIRQIGGDGATDEVADLLEDAQRDGQDVSYALPRYLVFQLRDADMQGRDVDKLLRESDMKLAQHGLSLPLQVVTEAVAILVQRSKFRQALHLWSAVCRRPSAEPYTLDLPILTVLLKANVGLFDCDGIRWVVKTLIAQEITADKQFRRILKDTAKSARQKLAAKPHMEYLKMMNSVLEQCLRDLHEWSVAPAVEARKEAQKKVLDIMMLAGARVHAAEQSDITTKDETTKIYGKANGKGEKGEGKD